MSTAFTAILRGAVERVPGAMGAIFADIDGEAVDHWARDTSSSHDLLVVGAQYGVILNRVQKMLNLFHFGEANQVMFSYDRMDLVVRAIVDGYYVVLVARGRMHLSTALSEIAATATLLRQEMAL